ncbi:MAG: hypothetical protein ACRDUV_26885, partial [Pseudonocardiaceae bacterium]
VSWMLVQVPGRREIGWVDDPDGVVQEVTSPAAALNAILKRPCRRTCPSGAQLVLRRHHGK